MSSPTLRPVDPALELRSFIESVDSQLPTIATSASPLPFRRSGLGASGLTFLPLIPETNFVMKFQSSVQTESEALATEVFRKIFPQFSIPNVYQKTHLLERHRKDMIPILGKLEIQKKDSAAESVLFMRYKQGSNLKYLTTGGQIFKLPREQFIYLFRSIGEIAGADLLIGNCDRFVLKNFRGEIDDTHMINSGNIMLEFPVQDFERAFQEIKNIHVIDNGPALLQFFEKSENRGLAAKSKEKDLGGQLRTNRFEDFKFYLNASDDQIQALATQIYIGFINSSWDALTTTQETEPPFTSKEEMGLFFSQMPDLIEAIAAGLQLTRRKLKSEHFRDKIEQVLVESSQKEPGTQIYKNFIQSNVDLAKGASS